MSDKLKSPHTQVAHSVLERLARANMSASCFRVTLWAIRNTYGYHRKETKPATMREIQEQTELPLGSVCEALKYLADIELLVKTENKGYFFNKHAIGVRPSEQLKMFAIPNKSVRQSEQNVRQSEHAIYIRSERNLKETLNLGGVGFVSFWKAYPKKSGRDAALAAWIKKNPPLDRCLKTLTWQIASPQWTKDGGQFIPKAASWIMDGCWNDVPLTHDLVTCTVCGHEGALKKGHSGPAVCGKCGSAEAL